MKRLKVMVRSMRANRVHNEAQGKTQINAGVMMGSGEPFYQKVLDAR